MVVTERESEIQENKNNLLALQSIMWKPHPGMFNIKLPNRFP